MEERDYDVDDGQQEGKDLEVSCWKMEDGLMMGEETGSVVDSSCEVSISDAVFGVDDNGWSH